MKKTLFILFIFTTTITACKKKGCTDEAATNYVSEAKKDDGSCVYAPEVSVPTSYIFLDEAGNNTVSFSGQTERLNQLEEITIYMKSGTGNNLNAEILKAMFANVDGDGSGNFSFNSSKQLKDKCFEVDIDKFEDYMDSLAIASIDFGIAASSGQAGTLMSGESTYLFSANGIEYTQLIEKGLMGAVFMYQATQVYFSTDKMNVDNTNAVDPAEGKYYTTKEHHWDEAFGYFNPPLNFPSDQEGLRFWAKYCNSTDAAIGSNSKMMNAFLKGRALISQNFDDSQINEQISIIRKTWEQIAAAQAVKYLEGAKSNFGSDNAKFLHELSEAYAFIQCLKYVPLETRTISFSDINELLETVIGDNFWNVSNVDLTNAINRLNEIYNF